MQLLRYAAKKEGCEKLISYDINSTYPYLEWFMKKDIIGMQQRASVESSSFLNDFIYAEDCLLIDPEIPSMKRSKGANGLIQGKDYGEEPLSKLMAMLKGSSAVHVYLAKDKHYPFHHWQMLSSYILNFSPHPPGDQYKLIRPMCVKITSLK